ncbi:MAG: macro domain-containing protein [candidate division WWE3 bacterium]|nr:macro domain-containing protein [candidate division WWE3 bacterium]
MRITLCTGDITEFEGGALICPSDTELTNSSTSITKLVLKKGRPDLAKEVSALGYIELGCAAIFKGYKLKVSHVIFVPVKDGGHGDVAIDYLLLHKALRSALTLADLYGVERLAIPMMVPRATTKPSIIRSLLSIDDKPASTTLTDDACLDIIAAVSRDFEDSTIKEISIYRNTKPQNVQELLPIKRR